MASGFPPCDCVDVTTESDRPSSTEPTRSAADDVRGDLRYRVLSPRTIGVWAVLIVLVGVGVAVWLLLAYTGGDAEANGLQLEAIRTAGTVVVGTGGAAALLLAARRQRSTEIALKQKDRDQADVARAYALQEQVAEQTRQHQERVAAATEADAEARRITDLYTKAAEQLGSEKAPVRLAGLYALERLAQDHPGQRQTIVNVLCAYLRMPYTLPGDSLDYRTDDGNAAAEAAVRAEYYERVQEGEVRLAAQRVLTTHLHPGADHMHPTASFWADIDVDLTGATLIDFNLAGCRVNTAIVAGAHFSGSARFDEAVFTGNASFNDAVFTGDARFSKAAFSGSARFSRAAFAGVDAGDIGARFDEAVFTGDAFFNQAVFTHLTAFSEIVFSSDAWFGDAKFDIALFNRAVFTDHAQFTGAVFTGDTKFDHAKFIGTYSAGVSVGGSHAPVVKSSRRASSLSIPHLVAVSR